MADTGYHTRTLPLARVDQAFPLIRELSGEISLEQWQRFARSLMAESPKPAEDQPFQPHAPRGIMIAERSGYIRGLFTYQPMIDLLHGDVLLVQNFTVMEVVRREAAAEALMTAATTLARELSCRAVHAMMGIQSVWAIAHLEQLGHGVEALALCHPLSAND